MNTKPREFHIDVSDYEKLDAFEIEHSKCRDRHSDACGGLLSYTFIPTGIGMAVSVECSCGQKLNLYGGMP